MFIHSFVAHTHARTHYPETVHVWVCSWVFLIFNHPFARNSNDHWEKKLNTIYETHQFPRFRYICSRFTQIMVEHQHRFANVAFIQFAHVQLLLILSYFNDEKLCMCISSSWHSTYINFLSLHHCRRPSFYLISLIFRQNTYDTHYIFLSHSFWPAVSFLRCLCVHLHWVPCKWFVCESGCVLTANVNFFRLCMLNCTFYFVWENRF